jgi:hypothetical protein
MNHAAPGLAPASDPAFRKPLSVSPIATQMIDGGLLAPRHSVMRYALAERADTAGHSGRPSSSTR